MAAAILSPPPRAVAQSHDDGEHARLTSPWFVRVGVLDAIYHPSAMIATSGQTIPGATASVSNNVRPMFDIGCTRGLLSWSWPAACVRRPRSMAA